jgi:acyl carrier protein
MTEDEFVVIVLDVRNATNPCAHPAAQGTLLDQIVVDSLDLLNLREELETRLDLPLSDEKFVATSSLRDLYRQVKEHTD